jgi:hypothetical protein
MIKNLTKKKRKHAIDKNKNINMAEKKGRRKLDAEGLPIPLLAAQQQG